MNRIRPSMFVGSSSEGLQLAKTVQLLLDHTCEVTVWSQGVFGLSQGTLESLVLALDEFDFAVLVLTPDDLIASRGEAGTSAPRDNVLFELGLFMGGLGRERTFIVYDREAHLKLPSDLAGVTAATYEPHANGRLESALGAACTRIENRIGQLGLRDRERLQRLTKATEATSARMQELIRIMARSRKVELDIIASQFGPMIAPARLREMQQDLADLATHLEEEDSRE